MNASMNAPMSAATLPLPPILAIGLERRGEQRRALASRLEEAGFAAVEWIVGVDGDALGRRAPWKVEGIGDAITPWRSWVDPYSRRAMTVGEAGCSLSHVAAWKRIVEANVPCLVLEDDAVPSLDLIPQIPLVLRDLAALDFDVCYFSHRNDPGPRPLAGRMVHVVNYHPLWTLAYLASPRGAATLLSSPWAERLIPADELIPATFALNSDPSVNRVYAGEDAIPGSRGMALSTHQRFFECAPGTFEASLTEKSAPIAAGDDAEASAFAVATEETAGFRRLRSSAERYGFEIEPLGMGETWRGGDMKGPGGGQKIRLWREAIRTLPSERPILLLDGYDVIATRHIADALAAWKDMGAPLLFAAETTCWPDSDRAESYPETEGAYRFLNSGGVLGTAGALREFLKGDVADDDDDQRFCAERFLSATAGGDASVALDVDAKIFQCLNGALSDVVADEGRGMLYNRRADSWPCFVHANGPSATWLDGEGRSVGGRVRTSYGRIVDES